tara:strand:+ start:4154 stop:4624 length:471 start_codon:yes stop_codon:yes gene_type:complete
MKIVKRSTKIAKNQINNVMQLMNVQNTIALLLTLFIVLDVKPNMQVASFVTSALGYLTLFVGLLVTASKCNPIVSIIYFIFAYELIQRSLIKTQKKIVKFMPGESTRTSYMKQTDFFPQTLEETVISEKVPPVNYQEPNTYEFVDNVSDSLPFSKI